MMFGSLAVVNVSTQPHIIDSRIVNTFLRPLTETRKIHESLETQENFALLIFSPMSKIRTGAPDKTSVRNLLLSYNFVMRRKPVFQRIYKDRGERR